MTRCEKHCGKDANCVYDVCPFEHEYTYEGEVVSGYKCVCDPIEDKLIRYAVEFKKNHECHGCPFIKNEVGVGVGTIRDCDSVCVLQVGEIIEYLRKFYNG